MQDRTKGFWTALFIAVLAVDTFPHYGPPEFRYTGCDLEVPVWNFGWPLPHAIYDQRDGLHMGPTVFLIIPAQLLMLATIWLIRAATRMSRKHDRAVRYPWLSSAPNLPELE